MAFFIFHPQVEVRCIEPVRTRPSSILSRPDHARVLEAATLSHGPNLDKSNSSV